MLILKELMSHYGSSAPLKKALLITLTGVMVLVVLIAGFQWQYFESVKYPGESILADRLTGLFIVISIVFFLSGAIKGVAGIGMGLVAVPALSVFYYPLLAVCVIAVPLVITNFWQGVVKGKAKETLVRYQLLFLSMVAAMLCSGYFADSISVEFTSFTLGFTAIAFAAINLGITLPKVSDAYDIPLQITCGVLAGFVGGITGLVVIPLVFYMICRCVSKDEFVSSLGLLLLTSGVLLVVCYGLNGGMTSDFMLLSTFAAAPALLGVVVGERIRPYVNDFLFRKIVLYIILAIGLKILLDVAAPNFQVP